jgi:hypothetical protein
MTPNEQINLLVRTLELLPDEIDIYRLLKAAGRKRADQARVVAGRLQEISDAALKGIRQ